MLLQNSNTTDVTAAATEKVTETTNVVSGSLDTMMNALAEQIPYIVGGIVVLVLFWFLAKIVRRVFLFASRRTTLDQGLRMLVGRLLALAIVVIGVFTSLTIIIPKFGFSDMIAGLGFSSFIVGFATKDILNNFLSGILVLWQEPFKLGDYVSVKDYEGEVKEIGVRATRLRMYDGDQVLIPNSEMYSSALTIRPAGAFQRVKIEVITEYSAPVGKSKERILSSLTDLDGVAGEPPPNVFLTRLTAEGIKLTAYFWVDTEKDSVMELFDAASTAINLTLREAGVKLFPAQRLTISDSGDGNPLIDTKEDM